MLGLSHWVVDFWQQPSNFNLDELLKSLSENLSKVETTAVGAFQSEVRHLKSHMMRLDCSSEMDVLVTYLKKSLREILPPRQVGMLGAFGKLRRILVSG